MSTDGLPPLSGTDKQVKWADALRSEQLRKVSLVTAWLTTGDLQDVDAWTKHVVETQSREVADAYGTSPEVLGVYVGALHTEDRAPWWIDHRYSAPAELFREIQPALLRRHTVSTEELRFAEEAKAEATVRPQCAREEHVAEVRLADGAVIASYPVKSEHFRAVMHDNHFRWDGAKWVRTIGPLNGTVADRAAEIGHRLLLAGIPIRIYDEEIRMLASNGGYEPECKRWIKRMVQGAHVGWFSVTWPRDEDWFAEAKRIPGAIYDKPHLVVPIASVYDLLDFADLHGFKFSLSAERLAIEAQVQLSSVVVEPPPPNRQPKRYRNQPPALSTPEVEAIDPALRDAD